jgi:hypothetical protein
LNQQRAFFSRLLKWGMLWGISLVAGLPALSYTLTQVSKGHLVHWSNGQKLFLAGNPENTNGITPNYFRQTVVHALQQWKHATQGVFDFEYWQGTDRRYYPTTQKVDGLNAIHFASQSGLRPDPNIIGHTQVWYNASTGAILEADIILNDVNYELTDNPTHTSSRNRNQKPKVFLNNIVTHEMGHAIGLSHSSSINSSMLYVEFLEQFKLGCDDLAAAKHLYPSSLNRTGKLEGVILGPDRIPLSGAVVTAISSQRGIPIASVHTNQNGKFIFGALESGSYSLMIDSYVGTPASIPSHHQTRHSRICWNNQFPKNFVTESDQITLRKFEVKSGMIQDIGFHPIRCDSVVATPVFIQQNAPKQFVDRADAGSIRSYTFQANGPFRVTAVAHLLLSPVHVELSIADSTGSILTPRRNDTLYRSKVSDYQLSDNSVSATAFGPITVTARVSSIEPLLFPTPAVNPGTEPVFMVHFHDESQARNGKFIPLNARCSSNQVFPEYRSPPGNPIRDASQTTIRDQIGFCGTANASTLSGGNPSHSRSNDVDPGALIGWMFPFLTAIVCRLYLKNRHAKIKE